MAQPCTFWGLFSPLSATYLQVLQVLLQAADEVLDLLILQRQCVDDLLERLLKHTRVRLNPHTVMLGNVSGLGW